MSIRINIIIKSTNSFGIERPLAIPRLKWFSRDPMVGGWALAEWVLVENAKVCLPSMETVTANSQNDPFAAAHWITIICGVSMDSKGLLSIGNWPIHIKNTSSTHNKQGFRCSSVHRQVKDESQFHHLESSRRSGNQPNPATRYPLTRVSNGFIWFEVSLTLAVLENCCKLDAGLEHFLNSLLENWVSGSFDRLQNEPNPATRYPLNPVSKGFIRFQVYTALAVSEKCCIAVTGFDIEHRYSAFGQGFRHCGFGNCLPSIWMLYRIGFDHEGNISIHSEPVARQKQSFSPNSISNAQPPIIRDRENIVLMYQRFAL